MPAVENVKCLVEIFNERFRSYDLVLTAEDVERGSGVIENGDDGWPLHVPYCFGVDADGDYLDYYFWYSYHQSIPDHYRIRLDRRDEQLPVQAPGYSYPSAATEEEKNRREQEHYAENRRISGMLSAKGFEASRINEDLPVQTVYVNRRDENGSWIVTGELNFEWRGNYDEALGAAKWLVEDALANLYRQGMTTAGLMALYRAAGPDPHLRYEDRALAQAANPISAWFVIYQPIPFNAWGYAEEVSHRLCDSGEFIPSRSLAGWQGRYDRYDRHRMESQLFLNRPVKLTRDIRHGEIFLPAGSTGKIATHGTDVDSDKCDYAREAPVIFDPEKLPLWRRTLNQILDLPDRRELLVVAVPYDAMEFVDDDAIYAAYLEDIYAEIR